MGAGPSASGLINGGPVVSLRDLASHATQQEWVENAFLQAALRLAGSKAYDDDDVGDLAFSDNPQASVRNLLHSFFDNCDRTMLPVKKLLWLGLAADYSMQNKPAVNEKCFNVAVEQTAAAPDARVFAGVVRWAAKTEEVLCDALLSHPTLQVLAGEGDRNIRVDRLLGVAGKDREAPLESGGVKQAVMWSLQCGSLKEVLMVTLAVMQLDSAFLGDQLSCMTMLSFLEMPQFVLDAQKAQQNRIVLEEESKVGDVCAVTGCRPEVAKSALEIVAWQLDAAVMLLMDDPGQVEAALEKKVLEQEEREIAALQEQEQRRQAVQEVREVNLAQQISQGPCFAGTLVQQQQGDTEGRQFQLMSLFRHLDRLLVELKCPLRLKEAPVERLIDGHILSLAFIDALLGIFSGELLLQHQDVAVPSYIVSLLLRLLVGNLARFQPYYKEEDASGEADSETLATFKQQQLILESLSSRLLQLVDLEAADDMATLVRQSALDAFKSGIPAFCASHELRVRFLQRLLKRDPLVSNVAPELFQFLKKDYVLGHFCSGSDQSNIVMLLEHVVENHPSGDALDLLFHMQTRLLFSAGQSGKETPLVLRYARTVLAHSVAHYDAECVVVKCLLGPMLSGLCLLRSSSLIDAVDMTEDLLSLAHQELANDAASLSLSLSNIIAYFLGKLASVLVAGQEMNKAELLQQFPMFHAGSVSRPSEALSRAQLAVGQVLPTVPDLLKTRTGKEIDEMVILSAAALLHHCPGYEERDAFCAAVALKLAAMRKLQFERTEGGIAAVCRQYSDRAALLLTFAPCGSAEGLATFIERGPDLQELSAALDEPTAAAASRERGFRLFERVLGVVQQSIPCQHVLKWISFSLRTSGHEESRHYLHSLQTVDRATHARIATAFQSLFHRVASIIKRARLEADDALCAIALSAWGVRFAAEDQGFLQQSGIINVLRDILSPQEDDHMSGAALKSSGTAYQFKVQQMSPDRFSVASDEHELSRNMAMQVMCLLVAQVAECSADGASPLEAEISQLLFGELSQCLPVAADKTESQVRPEEGESTADCQQLVSASRQFHRSGPGLRIPDLIRSPDGRANVCFSMWLLMSVQGSGTSQTLCFLGESRAFWAIALSADRYLQFNFCTEKKQLSLQSDSPLPAREWVHIAVTTRHRSVRMYVNGALCGKARTNTCVRAPGSFPLHMGTFYGCPVGSLRQGLDGKISDARFIPRIVSAQEVAQLHSQGPLLLRHDDKLYHISCLLFVVLRKAPRGSPLDLRSASMLLDVLRFGTRRVKGVAAPMLAMLAPLLPSSALLALRLLVCERLRDALSLECPHHHNVQESQAREDSADELLQVLLALLECDGEATWAHLLERADRRVLLLLMSQVDEAPDEAGHALLMRFSQVATGENSRSSERKDGDDGGKGKAEEQQSPRARIDEYIAECARQDDLCAALRAIDHLRLGFAGHVGVLRTLVDIALTPCIASFRSPDALEERLYSHRARVIDMQAMHKESPVQKPPPVTAEEEQDSDAEEQDGETTPPPPAKPDGPPSTRDALRKTKYGRQKFAEWKKKSSERVLTSEETSTASEEESSSSYSSSSSSSSSSTAPESEESKTTRLQQAVPHALHKEVTLALVISGGDYDRGLLWLLDRVEKRHIAEIQGATEGRFPKAWCKEALARCSLDPLAAASWLRANYLLLVEAQPDRMLSFKGDEAFAHRYFARDEASGKSRSRRRGGESSAHDAENTLVSQDFQAEAVRFCEAARQSAALCTRGILVSLMGRKDPGLLQVLSPAKLLCALKLLLFRGLAASGGGDTASQENAREFLSRHSFRNALFVEALVQDCVFQLRRLPVEEYSSFLGAEERFIPDATALWAPNVRLTEWLLGLLTAAVPLSDAHTLLISEGLAASLRCAHVGVKLRVLRLVSRHPGLLSALPVDRLQLLLLARYEREARGSHLAPHSVYLATLLQLASSAPVADRLFSAADRGTLLAPHAFCPQFAARANELAVVWFPLQRRKTTRSPARYLLEMSEAQAEGNREWLRVYEGKKESARIEGLSAGQSYVFRLQVFRGATRSSWSEECFGWTSGSPVLLDSRPASCAEHCVVDGSGRTASRPEGPNSWRCVTGQPTLTSGVHYWEVLVEQADWGAAFIGVAPPGLHNLKNTFGMAFANWRGLVGSSEKLFGEHFGSGAVVGILLDMERRRISFFKDDKFLGVAFSDIGHDAVVPTLGLKNRGTKLTILSNSGYSRGGVPAVDQVRRSLAVLRQLHTSNSGTDGGSVPISFLKLAYTEWHVWCRQTVKQYRAKPGFLVQLNISDSACAKLSEFRHGDVVKSPQNNQDYRILGVQGTSLWYEPVDGGPAWNWSQEFVRDWAPQFALVERGDHRALRESCEQMPFHKFCKLFEQQSSTAASDAQLVQLVDRACVAHECSAFNLAPSEVDSSRAPRVAYLRVLNECCAQLLPMVDFGTEGETGALMCRVKHLLFAETKRRFLDELLECTQTPTKLKEDEYTDPYNLTSIKVNRKKAAKYAGEEDPAKRLEASLFNQTRERLSGCGASLRQHYSGILDAGQRRTFKVQFLNEGVTDNGGPYRELFAQICDELHSADLLPYLVQTPNGRSDLGENRDLFLLNGQQTSEQHLRFLGQLMGMAMRSQIPLELHLSQVIWKHIVGETCTEEDLRGIDEVLHNLLCDIRDCQDEAKFRAMFEDVTWNVPTHCGQHTVALKGDGSEPVLYADRRRFFDAALHYKLEREGRQQLQWLLEGLASIVPVDPLRVFSAAQLELVVCGEPHISVELLKRLAVYEGVSPDEPHVKWMWRMLEEMSQAQRAQFLQFVWARRRLPQSVSATQMRFKVQAPASADDQHNADSRLPTASTCFFSIALPRYSSYQVLKSRIAFACQNCISMDADFRLSERDVHLSRSL